MPRCSTKYLIITNNISMTYQKVLRIGRSLGIIFPKPICRQLGINRGDYVVMKVLEDQNPDNFKKIFYIEIWKTIELR